MDAKGNLLAPELHHIQVTVQGGYLIDTDGKHMETLSLDTIESQIPIAF